MCKVHFIVGTHWFKSLNHLNCFQNGVAYDSNYEQATDEEKSEAAGLLAQVTSPWIENNCSIEGLSNHLDNLVASLTGRMTINSDFWYLKSPNIIQKLFFRRKYE